MSGIEVQDAGDLRKYRTEVPNLVFEMGLSPYALALYMHFRRTAGDDGKCWKSTRTLASDTGISAGTISKARKELEERELIGVQYPENNNKSIVVTIADIWPENFQHFTGETRKRKAKPAPTKTRSRRDAPVQETNAPVQETNATCSPGERRKEPIEEGTIEESPPTEGTEAVPGAESKEKKQEPTWPGDEAPTKDKQSYFIAYLHNRLEERELLDDKPITASYKKQLAGEVATHLNKGFRRGRILAGLDYVVFRWRQERVGLSVGIDRAEGQDNVRQIRRRDAEARPQKRVIQ